MTIQWWRGWGEHAGIINRAHQRGFPTVQSCGWYLDDLNGKWEGMYTSEPKDAANPLTLGGEAAHWGEHAGPSNLDHRIFSRLAAVAEKLWSPGEVTRAVTSRTALRHVSVLCNLRRSGRINVGPSMPDYCPPLLKHGRRGHHHGQHPHKGA